MRTVSTTGIVVTVTPIDMLSRAMRKRLLQAVESLIHLSGL